MGVTYKAFDARLRIDVALKVTTLGQVEDPIDLEACDRALDQALRSNPLLAQIGQIDTSIDLLEHPKFAGIVGNMKRRIEEMRTRELERQFPEGEARIECGAPSINPLPRENHSQASLNRLCFPRGG